MLKKPQKRVELELSLKKVFSNQTSFLASKPWNLYILMRNFKKMFLNQNKTKTFCSNEKKNPNWKCYLKFMKCVGVHVHLPQRPHIMHMRVFNVHTKQTIFYQWQRHI